MRQMTEDQFQSFRKLIEKFLNLADKTQTIAALLDITPVDRMRMDKFLYTEKPLPEEGRG